MRESLKSFYLLSKVKQKITSEIWFTHIALIRSKMKIYQSKSSIIRELSLAVSFAIFLLIILLQATEDDKKFILALVFAVPVMIAFLALTRLKIPLLEFEADKLYYHGYFRRFKVEAIGTKSFFGKKYFEFSCGNKKSRVLLFDFNIEDLERINQLAQPYRTI